MWLAKQITRTAEENSMTAGRVTLSAGGELGVVGESEYRQFPLFAPAGLRFRPAEGEQLLLARLEGQTICLGAAFSPTDLEPGELELRCGPGYLRLCQDGSVHINGLIISPQGTITEGGGGNGL